jgi:hypothetical protein
MLTPTIESVLAPFRSYPKTIQQAIFRVETHPSFSVLTRSMRKVLKAFLTRASKMNGLTPVKARVDRLAEEAEVCTKTVQRTILTLRKLGWLTQMSDGRSEWGVYTFRMYAFSKTLCELVSLPYAGEKQSQETDLSDGLIKDLNFKKDQQEISRKNQQGKPVELPSALQEIITMGVKDTGVAKLRGLAHEAGHKLEDIFTVAKSRLKDMQASGNRVYRYLERMIQRPSDYASRAEQVIRISSPSRSLPENALQTDRYRHKRYVGPQGIRVRVFDGIAEVCLADGRFLSMAGKDLDQIYRRIESGDLREVMD